MEEKTGLNYGDKDARPSLDWRNEDFKGRDMGGGKTIEKGSLRS